MTSGRGDLGRQHPERARPAQLRPRSPGAATSVAAVATRSTMPSNSTASSHRHRQRLVHDRDRGDPAYRLLQRGPGVGRADPAGLQAQQRRHRLQVVLHPVVDLADGRVLGHQLPVPAADLGDVADQHQRADRHAGRHQRQRPLQHGRAAGLDLLAGRRLAAQRGQDPLAGVGALQRVVGEPAGQRGQVLADEVGGEAEPAVRGLRVRAGVGDLAAARRAGSARRRPAARRWSRPGWRGGGKVPSATIWARSSAVVR